MAAKLVMGRKAAPIQVTGLLFPRNGEENNDVGLEWTGADLIQPFPATYIWECFYNQQTGFHTNFFWGPNPTFTGGGYYGPHPYPLGSPGSEGAIHNWEVSIEGADDIVDENAHDTTVVKLERFKQAFIVDIDPENEDEIIAVFQWDLRDLTKVIVHPTIGNYVSTFPPVNPTLSMGRAPWAPGVECMGGMLRNLQHYAAALSPLQCQIEANGTHPNTPETELGRSSVWFRKLNPTPNNVFDDSGQNHHPEWATDNRPTLWTP